MVAGGKPEDRERFWFVVQWHAAPLELSEPRNTEGRGPHVAGMSPFSDAACALAIPAARRRGWHIRAGVAHPENKLRLLFLTGCPWLLRRYWGTR